MNILLVNDDGYGKKGFNILYDVLKEYGDVYISAPIDEKSGASCSVTITNKPKIITIDERTIMVGGTPADCTIIGLAFYSNVKFDLVVSGINDGFNRSIDTLFSGTVGAGIVGAINGIKVICFSADRHFFDNLSLCTKLSLDYIFENNLLDICSIISVNFPIKKYHVPKGIKYAYLYNSRYNIELVKGEGENEFMILPKQQEGQPNDSDIELNKDGYISITPLKPSLLDIEAYHKLIKK